MTNINKNVLFMIASAISFLGASLISFLTGSLVNEKSQKLFQYLYSFSTGIIFGIALSFGLHPYIVTEVENYQIVHLITSLSFTVMLGIKFYYTISSYDYNHVQSNNILLSDHNIELVNNKMSTIENKQRMNNSIVNKDEDQYHNKSNEIETINQDSSSEKSKLIGFKVNLLVLITSASITDLLLGLLLSFMKDNSLVLFAIVFIERCLIAISIGTLLESSAVPSSLFLSAMFTCSLSAPIGVCIGLIIHTTTNYNSNNTSTINTLVILEFLYSISHSFSCGIYLYIALMHMIPTAIYQLQERQYQNIQQLQYPTISNTTASNNNTSSSLSRQVTVVDYCIVENSFLTHKLILFITFIIGYLCIIVPNILSSY